MCVYCVPSTVLGAFYALFPHLRISSQHRLKQKKIFFSLILQDEEVQPQRSCDLPKGYTGKLEYDSTFFWVPVPTCWLSLLERGRDMF